MSEDAEFSERAVKAGFEIWVDERIKPIHLTSLGYVQYKK
jgi:GT2 family glycosyltransferase